jgi:predicted GNAT family acetyltransferase
MHPPPQPILVSPLQPGAADILTSALAESCPDAPGVNGTSATADAVAAAWRRLTKAEVVLHQQQRIHRLVAVSFPRTPPGGWRRAAQADRQLLLEWSDAFELEAEGAVTGASAGGLDARLAAGRVFLWVDGTPVSYAGATPAVGGVARVGPVYTPPAHRGRGYASALVAAISQTALDGGATACMLYTDLANRTSSEIYEAIGYRPAAEIHAFRFIAQPSDPAAL